MMPWAHQSDPVRLKINSLFHVDKLLDTCFSSVFFSLGTLVLLYPVSEMIWLPGVLLASLRPFSLKVAIIILASLMPFFSSGSPLLSLLSYL